MKENTVTKEPIKKTCVKVIENVTISQSKVHLKPKAEQSKTLQLNLSTTVCDKILCNVHSVIH